MPTSEIITIGTELLLGETTDTNTRHIAQTLRGLGIDLYRTQTVGDNAARIAEIIREALQRADIVITTGGLGPTVDDPTRQAIADATGCPLEFHPELWEQIVNRISRYGRKPTENQKRQAYIPEGAIVIENPVGTAPAFIVEILSTSRGRGSGVKEFPSALAPFPFPDVRVVITLPGVPREMETLLADAVVPYLQKRFNLMEVIKVRTLHVSGIGEGALDEQVGDLEALTNPTVGLTAHSGVVDIRIAAKASTTAEAEGMIGKVEQDVRLRLGDNLFGADTDTLESVTLEALARRGWNLATFESGLTEGLTTRLNHISHPAYQGGRSRLIELKELIKASEILLKEMDASVVLGVALSKKGDQQDIAMISITPLGKQERHLTYGGHPKNAARWAVNTALDWLRRIAQKAG
jgi:nicotinamide-nucleotide amidase